MASNGSLPDQATVSPSANMALLDNNTDSDSEYFDASEYLEDSDESDSEDEFQDARDSFSDEVELPQLSSNKKQDSPNRLVEKENQIPSAAATTSVLSEKRKFENVAQHDQDTDINSPSTSGSSCDVSENRAKKQKPAIVFGQSSGFGSMKVPQVPSATGNTAPTVTSFAAAKPSTFGTMKVPQIASAIGNTAPTVSLFSATKPFTFGASTTANNTLFNGGSTSAPDDSNKENDSYNDVAKAFTFGEAPRETVAGVKETEVTTGEEDEETIFESKGKLYVMDANRNWKDHGVGAFRLNMDNNGSRRLLMRTDNVHRLMLNQKLFAGMNKFVAEEEFIRFGTLETKTSEENGTETRLANYALKVANATKAQDLCQQINMYIPKNRLRKRKVYKALDDDDEKPPSLQAESGRPLSPKKQRNL